jgi:hypothetical protein
MTRSRLCATILATALSAIAITASANADTTTTTSTVTKDGYTVTLTGPNSSRVGQPTTYSATCGGAPCLYGEFRIFGGVTNRLGEGFGTGATRTTTFRAAGVYQIRYRVGRSCVGSPNRACPIDVWLSTSVTA